jgi:glucokinase
MEEVRKYYVGIDLGGTFIKGGIVDDLGNIVYQDKTPTESEKGSDGVANNIASLANSLMKKVGLTKDDIEGLGMGVPGMIDSKNGTVIYSNNLNWKDFRIGEKVSQLTGLRVKIANDANVAALAEVIYGCAKNYNTCVMFTLGTGVGGGIIINNNIYEGNGGAGELGHITYVKNGIECNCGRQGCYEKYVSARALSNRAKELMSQMDNEIPMRDDLVYASDLSDKYDQGDKCAIRIVDEYVEDFSNLVMSLCNSFRPEKIVIGGGICHAPKIIGMMADRCKMYNYGYKGSPAVQIVRAKLGNNAGILGAVTCF